MVIAWAEKDTGKRIRGIETLVRRAEMENGIMEPILRWSRPLLFNVKNVMFVIVTSSNVYNWSGLVRWAKIVAFGYFSETMVFDSGKRSHRCQQCNAYTRHQPC